MVWGTKVGRGSGFPAIEIRPRPPAASNPRPRSPASSLDGTGEITNASRSRHSTSADHAPLSTSAPDILSSENASGRSPTKRPRVRSPRLSSGPRERRQHKCSLCGQLFARAEHLTRHERSHRKERPFGCPHCDATFTRKDLVKRHLARNHSELPPPPASGGSAGRNAFSSGASPKATTMRQTPPPNAEAPPQMEIHFQASSLETATTGNAQHMDHAADLALPVAIDQQTTQHSLEYFDFESLMGEMDGSQLLLQTPSASNGILNDDPNTSMHYLLDLPSLDHLTPHASSLDIDKSLASLVGPPPNAGDTLDVDPAQFITFSQPDGFESPLYISERKRDLIVQDMENVFSLARVPDTFLLPSCMGLERYITAFFDAFLIHAPCVHVPTFQAEGTQPPLLLAMAAIGAIYHEEKDVATQLHRAARLSILNQMERTSFTSKGRPTWVLQSLLFTMVFGVWRDDFDAVQESLAFQSNLAHIVRYVSNPGGRWVDDTQDSSLSWHDWIELESAKRTKFVIYTFFNDLTMAYNVPPVLTNSEIEMDLPCHDSTWIADSAASWGSHRSTPTVSFQITLRNLMSGADIQSIRCSTFGCHVILSALLQQIWQSRQAASPSDSLTGSGRLEAALESWHLIATNSASEASVRTKEKIALPYDSMAMLRVAYVMLCVDISRLKAVICRQNVQDIAQAMSTQCSNIQRSRISSKAALFAVHAFRRVVKAGVNVVARRGFLELSPQSYLCWFDNCLFISKWLQNLEATQHAQPLTDDEQNVHNLVQRTLYEANPASFQSTQPFSAQLMYMWATVFTRHETWGIVSILGTAMQMYSDPN
ncbi:fungal-specific transcription factor domain-containing protein [Exophiala viscosa]|uniref:Fungal-specific transcription factor domain-containing protein n=2 Tax=Exophiala viscosa TaxID=2486360 RepID=A0AAN6DTF7_9EURO|nr:fungal-specific transcription factor domain-containing protein [Exophiala viscosa]